MYGSGCTSERILLLSRMKFTQKRVVQSLFGASDTLCEHAWSDSSLYLESM